MESPGQLSAEINTSIGLTNTGSFESCMTKFGEFSLSFLLEL